jgi:hypothetical protein
MSGNVENQVIPLSIRVVIDPVVTVNTVTEENIDNATIWHGTLDLTYKIY